ncbi:MAG: LamG domain-containing protein [Candidatus Gracilibacteria bacterium]|nr:LamG domain-containing protein [Candidatus Gracilibacteria bacterium]
MKKLLSFILSLTLILGNMNIVNVNATGSSDIPTNGLIGEFLFEKGGSNTLGGNNQIKGWTGVTKSDTFDYAKSINGFTENQGLSQSFWFKDLNQGQQLIINGNVGTEYRYLKIFSNGQYINTEKGTFPNHTAFKKKERHHMVIVRPEWGISAYKIYIDSKLLGTITNTNGFNRLLNMHNVANIRLYEKALTENEILALYQEIKGDFTLTKLTTEDGIISKVGNNYKIKLKVQDEYNIGEEMNISYAYDSNNYSNINTLTTDINQQVEKEVLIPYNTTANLLKIKVNDGTYEHEISYNIDEEYRKNEITITGKFTGGIQTYSATSQYGNISGYSLTENNICNETLTFIDYSGELNFSDKQNNGKQVCFKAVHGDNITNYKVSNVMEGIAEATTPVKFSDLFAYFNNWKYSTSPKDFDPLLIILKQLPTFSKGVLATSNSTNYPSMFTDINGDSLPDILITSFETNETPHSTSTHEYKKYAIMLNKGNMNFEVAYRCVQVTKNTNGKTGFYGDCAK